MAGWQNLTFNRPFDNYPQFLPLYVGARLMNWKIKEKIYSAFKRHGDQDGPDEGDGDRLSPVARKVKTIMADTFKVDLNAINEDTSPDNLDRWTSLKHVDLVLNLQQAFDIEFTDSQIVEELFTYKTIGQTVEAALTKIAG
jgi:acyl carrier protein